MYKYCTECHKIKALKYGSSLCEECYSKLFFPETAETEDFVLEDEIATVTEIDPTIYITPSLYGNSVVFTTPTIYHLDEGKVNEVDDIKKLLFFMFNNMTITEGTIGFEEVKHFFKGD